MAHERIKASICYLMVMAKDALVARGEYTEGFNIWKSDLYIFGRADGTVTETFAVGFGALLEAAGLRYGNDGETRRTLYSLRHAYASLRIQYDQTDIYLLAKNMGTSVEMIEKFYGHTSNLRQAGELTKSSNRAKVESIFDFLAP